MIALDEVVRTIQSQGGTEMDSGDKIMTCATLLGVVLMAAAGCSTMAFIVWIVIISW